MKNTIFAFIVALGIAFPSQAASTQTADEAAAGLPPLTPEQALFTPADPDDKGVAAVPGTDAGVASEIAVDKGSSEGAAQIMEDEMDAGVTDDMSP